MKSIFKLTVSTRSSKGKSRSTCWARGFTLLELMLAAAIMVIAILGLLSLLINCMVLNDSNKNLVAAANDAQYVLEQIRGLPFANITGSYSPPTFTINDANVTPQVTVFNITTNLKEVTVNVSWTGRQRNRSFILSTRFAR